MFCFTDHVIAQPHGVQRSLQSLQGRKNVGHRGALLSKRKSNSTRTAANFLVKNAAEDKSHETDVVIIGAGIGGLCAGALLAMYGKKVTVCESHNIPGGAAHAWKRDGYTFESGPSLYSGMASRPSNNPIGQILDALDEPLPCIEYNTWMCHLPVAGSVLTEVGNDQFLDILSEHYGQAAVDDWLEVKRLMKPLAAAATVLPSVAVRTDLGALFTLGRFLPELIKVPLQDTLKLMEPFEVMVDGKITDPFILNWLNLMCFLLSGKPSSGTLAAEIGYMFEDWYRPNSMLEFPVGGSGAIVDALVRGLEKHGGRLVLNAHVESIETAGAGEDRRASGVLLRGGARIGAQTVISNATVWDTMKLVPDGALPAEYVEEMTATGECGSFMHLHLGIDATGLPDDLEIHHIVVNDWDLPGGVEAPQNVVLVSIASVLDPSLAPEGKHVIHAYTPGSEPYSVWEGLERGSEEYNRLKEERSQVLWRAVEKAIPDVRQRVEVEMVGTPLTCARFLRRHNGTYGGFGWVGNGKDVVPSPQTPLKGLMMVGDSNFPGPGVPAVAAGGAIAAHSLVPFWTQNAMLNKVVAKNKAPAQTAVVEEKEVSNV